MSHHPLREDKTCLNCRHVVEKRYCPNCGQENTATRKTFYELFVHFFEDLTHYENSFWKTIRNLLARPAALTKEYLSGKRMSYLAPVRLYIFISFMAFLIVGVLPEKKKEEDETTKTETVASNEEGVTIPKDTLVVKETDEGETDFNFGMGSFKSVRELDSAQAAMPEEERYGYFGYKLEHRLAEIREKSPEERKAIKSPFIDNIKHNIPKAIFMYMPFFALWLWLFHGKKRWYYFDHGIFTLHYFSFLLLTYGLYQLVSFGFHLLLPDWIDKLLRFVVGLGMLCWWFFYFFRSHRLFYGETRLVSRLKSLALFFINLFFMSLFLSGFMLISYLNTH